MPAKPQDHLPAKPPADRVRTVTWEDREYSIDPAALDDITFMELLSEMDTKPFYIAKVVAHMLGEEQWERFKREHADDNGRLSTSRVGEFFTVLNTELTALGN